MEIKKKIQVNIKYLYLLKLLVKKEIKKKYRNSILGIFWSLLYPLLDMVVLTLVFSSFLSRGIKNFPVYLLCGRLLFNFFSSTTNNAMNSMVGSASLIRKISVPKYVLLLSKVISGFIIFLISLIALFIVMIVTKAKITVYILYAPLYLLTLLLFVTGIGFVLCTINIFFRDIEHLYNVFLTILMYASAIFYSDTIVPVQYRFILNINPLYHYIKGFRNVVYLGNPIDWNNYIICIGVAIVSLIIGLTLYKKNESRIIFYL